MLSEGIYFTSTEFRFQPLNNLALQCVIPAFLPIVKKLKEKKLLKFNNSSLKVISAPKLNDLIAFFDWPKKTQGGTGADF